MTAEQWPDDAQAGLAATCRQDCVTARAIIDAAGAGLIPEPTSDGAWLALKEDDELVLYVVTTSALYRAHGKCAHHEDPHATEDHVNARVDLDRLPIRHDSAVSSFVTRSEKKPKGGRRTRTIHWTVELGGRTIPIDAEPDSDSQADKEAAKRAVEFARALTTALAAASPARYAILDAVAELGAAIDAQG